MEAFLQKYDSYKNAVEEGIAKALRGYKEQVPKILMESMEYSALGGGKCIRGVLVLGTGEMLGIDENLLIKYAVAAEMIHASSLIHDDMPCMDNDTMRRGKPCNHIAYGEAVALYAGLGLLNTAYELLLSDCGKEVEIKAAYELMKSAGVKGIMKGQSLDILNEGRKVDFDTLKTIHACKTGALLRAVVVIPAILSGKQEAVESMEIYGENIGTAFQIVDDILDVTASSEDLGKTAGKDLEADKLTYVKIFGVDRAKEMAQEHIDTAISALDSIEGNSSFLKETAEFILNRRK